MILEQQRLEDGTYLFGEKSRIGNWILNHPFHIASSCVCISLVFFINDTAKLIACLSVDAFLFCIALMVRLLAKNLCYWIIVDPKSETIRFFRCFNKGIVDAPIRSVEFVFDIHFACLYRGERFTIHNGYMHLISELLPPGMEIKFSDGLYARFIRSQIERNRRRPQRP